MNKSLVIGLVIGMVVAGGIFYLAGKKGNSPEENNERMADRQKISPSEMLRRGPGQGGQRPSLQGQKLSSTQFASNAVLVFPGTLSSDAKAVLVGFNLTTKATPDGSTQVSLTPTESGYTFQQYVVKQGQSLYFIEMNRADDSNGTTDINNRDDFALIVDQNGVIQ